MTTTITFTPAQGYEEMSHRFFNELFDFNTSLFVATSTEWAKASTMCGCILEMSGLNIKEGDTILIDMDGTLINTDVCNTKAYKAAIEVVLGGDYAELLDIARIERRVLRERLSWISEEQLANIIALKERFYTQFIDEIRIIPSTMEILNRLSRTHKVFLVTNARRGRTMQTLCHLGLGNMFDGIITKDDCNGESKFNVALTRFNLNPQDVWVFENEEVQVMAAVTAGININHIILK